MFGGIFTISCDGEVVPPNIPFKDEKLLSFGNIKNDPLSKITANMHTKKAKTPKQFDYLDKNMFNRMTAPKLRVNKYLKSVGYKKLNIIYYSIDKFSKELGEE